MINWPAKDPGEVADYVFNWSPLLQNGETPETIVSKTVTADGVTVDDSAIDGETVRVWLSGGAQGTVARVNCTIVTSSSPARTFVEVAFVAIGGGPVSLDQAKAHLRVDFDTEDALIAAYLSAAVGAVENFSSRKLSETLVVQRFDGFTDRQGRDSLRLWHGPVVSIEGLTYLDGDGTEQALSEDPLDGDYRAVDGDPYYLLPPVADAWPATLDGRGTVKVTYIAGYGGAAGPCPGELAAAVLLMLAHLYLNREAVVTGTIATELPLGVQALCNPFRTTLLG
jgi:uncharacterized phiE125 gp8 family phage protein